MIYLIHAETYDILAAFPDDTVIPQLESNLLVRQSDVVAPSLNDLVYDPTLDNVRLKTDEEKLQEAKEVKLEELKADIQAKFSNLPDALADAVKAIKLNLKMALGLKKAVNAAGIETTQDLEVLEDHLELILQQFEQIYPDDYAIDCVSKYTQSLVSALYSYYQAKMKVLQATTIEEVEAVEMSI